MTKIAISRPMKSQKTLYHISILVFLFICVISTPPLVAQDVKWHSFDEALAIADTSHKSILVDIWAPWCGWCHKMKKEVYPALSSHITDHFILTRLNRDNHEPIHTYRGRQLSSAVLAREWGVHQVPSIVLLSPKNDVLLHLSGFIEAATLERVLQQVNTLSSQ